MSTPLNLQWNPKEEFWWLPQEVSPSKIFCYLVEIEPFDDEGKMGTIKYAPSGSADETNAELVPISYIPEWWQRFDGINLHRSMSVHVCANQNKEIIGPFLVDIDGDIDQEFLMRVERTQRATIKVIDWLIDEFSLDVDDLRCYFSGSKGFHVEVRPEALNASGELASDTEKLYREIRKQLLFSLAPKTRSGKHIARNTVEGAVIDRIHCFKRLSNSINSWWENYELRKSRQFRITKDDLANLRPQEIVAITAIK